MGYVFYYIDQPDILSSPVGIAETESDISARSVETGSGRWILVVAVISVGACFFYFYFILFYFLDFFSQDTGIGVFWLHCTAWCKETKLGKNNQEASPSAGKTTGAVLVPCCT